MAEVGLLELNIPQLPAGVGLAISCRQGGQSLAPFDGNNLALHVGDKTETVQQNRSELLAQLPGATKFQWLNQIHGSSVVESTESLRQIDATPSADACFSRDPGIVCSVLSADCLPVLFWDNNGDQVLAAHAGWRGLAGGVLRRSVEAFAGKQLNAYLGPAISQTYFEVGIEVLEQFFATALDADHMSAIGKAFKPSSANPLKFYADLYQLARAELGALGVSSIYGGDYCSYRDTEHFYSYRRACHQQQPETGRMASMIWLKS